MREEKASYGFTKFSNVFLDDYVHAIDNVCELKVIITVFRKTVGFQKGADTISLTQFQEFTGMTRHSVIDGLKMALERGVVIRERIGQSWSYRLQLVQTLHQLEQEASAIPALEVVQTLHQLSPKVVQTLHTQKKGLNKTIKKGGEEPGAIAPTPQKSITTDLEETFFYPGYQPETVPDQEPTSPPPPPTSRQEAHAPYPATPTPKTGKKVKGVSVPVAGGVEKPKKEKEVDPRCEHPTVKFYQKQMHYSATGEQLDLLTGEDFDFEKLSAAMKYWRESGYFKGNVRGVIDTYHKRSFENGLPGTGNRNDRGRSMGGAGSARPVTTNGATAKANADYWNRPAEEIEREWAEFKL